MHSVAAPQVSNALPRILHLLLADTAVLFKLAFDAFMTFFELIEIAAFALVAVEITPSLSYPADTTLVTMVEGLAFIVAKEITNITEVFSELNATILTVPLGFLFMLALEAADPGNFVPVKSMVFLWI